MMSAVTEFGAVSTHTAVMVVEALDALAPSPGGKYIDCNLGDGGHTEAVLRSADGVRVLGIDMDYGAICRSHERLSIWGSSVSLYHGNFAEVAEIARHSDFSPCSGVLFDLGVSSAQLDTTGRGFSFRHDARLDMRFDQNGGLTAYDCVNGWSETVLETVIADMGGEPRAKRVARAIVRERPIETTAHLAKVVTKALAWPKRSRIHPATRTFQALRMAVNNEIGCLKSGLRSAVDSLERGGRMVVISYHSIEDRIVKRFMRERAASCVCPPRLPQCICERAPSLRLLSRKVIKPSVSEVRNNPRARSARMRIAERI